MINLWEFIGNSFHSQLTLLFKREGLRGSVCAKAQTIQAPYFEFLFLARAKNTTFQNKNSCNHEYIILPDFFKQVFVNDNSLVLLEGVGQFS